MDDAGETTGSGAYRNSPSVDTRGVATVIPDHGSLPLGGPGAADSALLRRLVPSARSEGREFNSSI